ncbi:flocculation protein FLO11-like [Asterias rubens]|uniref:flocculation protein FLO11-like n=1 Tax=Asterias rubens TaxID=7604 RepID=UPI001455C78D|nr:flocculation protein FLO11-like [Asterias rubens]
MGSKVEDIRWSKRSYTLREALKRCTFPQIMKVSIGFVSSDENETLSKDQILRIHQNHTQTRVLAGTKKNKFLSIPLRYADARFEVVTSKKRSKPMYMRDVIDRSLLPQEVTFHFGDDLTFDLQTAKGSVSEKLSPLLLRNMYEVSYLQGNAIYHNHLDTQVINIPLHLPIEVNLAEGFTKHSVEQWGRYQSLLEKLVSKHVTFELFPGNQKITFFSDKRLEKAESQEDYEKIWPIGTLYITSANERLRSKTTTGAGVSRTVGHTAASATAVRRVASPSPQVTKNGDAGRGRQMTKSASASIMMSTDTVPRNSRPVAKVVSKGSPPVTRPLPVSSATMPRSILQRGPSQEALKNNVQPPPLPTSARPTKGSPTQDQRPVVTHNHTSATNSRQDGTATRGRVQKPPPITTTPAHYSRKRSPSVDSTPSNVPSYQRNSSPSVGARPDQILVSSAGRVRKGPISSNSPTINETFGARSVSSTSSTDSNDYTHLKTLPVDIPAPDYDPNETVFQYPGAVEAKQGPPPTPPPISSIPVKPKAPAPTFSPQISQVGEAGSSSTLSSPASSLSSIPGALALAPPPPPGPPPPPPPAPAPGLPAPPPPPPPPGLDWKAPSQQVSHTPIAKPQPKPVRNNEPSMNTMMMELKKAQQRRMSTGIILEDAVDSGKVTFGPSKQSPRSTGALKTQAPSGTNELQSILSSRLRKTSTDRILDPGNVPSVAPKPTPGRFKVGNKASSSSDTFSKVEDIPTNLKGLTVAQVTQSLRLLNLDKYAEVFKNNQVDGEMMITLSKDILRTEFKVSEFDSQKIMKFLGGWRPK